MLSHRQHLMSLDGLRGIAILMVCGYHLYPPSNRDLIAHVFVVGWLGVDLFFVLSGFLITGILYDTMAEPRFFRTFYARRAARLLPVYVVVVSVVLAVNAWLGGRPTVWAVPFFAYASNIVRDMGRPLGLVTQVDVSHFWSLGLEEQFYLFWPIAVFLARTRKRIFWICLAGGAASLALRWAVTLPLCMQRLHWLGTPYFELPMRLDGLLGGGALAMLLRGERTSVWLTSVRLSVTAAISAVALGLCFFGEGNSLMYNQAFVRYGYAAAAVLFFALLALALQPDTWVRRVGELPALRAVGRCSYGLYLIHFVPVADYWEVLKWVKRGFRNERVGHLADVLCFGVYLALCIGVATLSYRTLEKAFLRLKPRYQDEG